MSAFGERDKVQETTIPSKQSTTGGKPALVPVHGELGDVRDPQHVRRVGVEVPLHEVRRGLADLAGVGAPPLRLYFVKSVFRV